MSTRCTITVRESKNSPTGYSIYRHSDGYPDTEHGVIATLSQALTYAWPLPRFEPDDFAAAIVAAWKQPAHRPVPSMPDYISQGGNIRFTEGRDAHGDTEFHYEIYPDVKHKGALAICTYQSDDSDNWKTVGNLNYLTRAMQASIPACEDKIDT